MPPFLIKLTIVSVLIWGIRIKRIRLIHEYLVSDGKNEFWAECILEFNYNHEETYEIGERVLCFSKNNYTNKEKEPV